MDTIRSLMANPALGLSRSLPVLNSEAGILQDDFAALGNNHTFGAGFLARTFVLNFALGVRHCCWYAYDAGGYLRSCMWRCRFYSILLGKRTAAAECNCPASRGEL
jgi:hypothetical protein